MPEKSSELAQRLFTAFETGVPIAPLTETEPGIDIPAAYAVQRELLKLHEGAGRSVSGRKIGLTSLAIQRQLNVSEPDFGFILDSYVFANGHTVSVSAGKMIAPRLEAELAFVLDRDLAGPGVTEADVMAATRQVVPVYELLDSRIADWKIKLPDTVADNASCYGAVLGDGGVGPDEIDLATVGLVIERDGEQLATAAGAAVMGHPARAVAWLANTLGEYGEALPAGQPVLSGSFTAALDAELGTYTARFGEGLGTVEVTINA
jgi:2-oxopent-4-enoate hydratase